MLEVLKRPRVWFVPYVIVSAIAAVVPRSPTDLEVFFWPSARVALSGRPLDVYAVNGLQAYPNANGPVGLIPLVLVQEVARPLGWLDAYYPRRVLVMIVFSFVVVLMAREAVLAIERVRGQSLTGLPRLLTYAVLTLAPPIWQSLDNWGQVEQPVEIWLVLVATRWASRRWPGRAGVVFALACLTRSSAVLFAVPIGLASWRRGPGDAVRLTAVTIVTGVAGLLPFLVADPSDVVHSLFTYRGALPPGAGSIWAVLRDTGASAVAQHWDVAFVVGATVAGNIFLASRPGGLTDERVLAGLALAAASFALLAKTVWPYYFFEVYVLTTVWVFGRWTRRDGLLTLVAPPVAVSLFSLLAEVGSVRPQLPVIVAREGAAMFVLLGVTAFWIAWRAARFKDSPARSRGDSLLSP